MQRREYNVRMTDELITAEIMEFYGKGGIPGVTQASCEALCEAHGAAGRRAPRRHLHGFRLQARRALLVR